MQQLDTLWAIAPHAMQTVLQLSRHRLTGGEAPAPMALVGKPSTQGRGENKVAVIPVQGVLTKDGPSCYGSNYGDIADAVEKAAADPDVKRIVLSVDSPGGEVTGLPECAAVIAAAARVKPVHAMVEGTAASAAYWLASQASDITLTPSGEVGSVGVRMMHVDMSKMLDDAGFKVTELQSGDFKTEWSPYKELSKAAQDDMQRRLDATHRDFVSAVASGRGRRATAAITKSRFGEGRMFSANDALGNGLVDRIQSPRAFRAALGDEPVSKTRPGAGALRPAAAAGIATPASANADISTVRARLNLERLRV